MKETYRDKDTKISPTKNITEHNMASGPSEKVKDSSALVTQISSNKYRVEVESMFHCRQTGIKFEVESKAIIEYSLEYGNDYFNLIQENGCELLGPIFNVQVKDGRVSAVYLPHYVCLEGFRRDKSLIKFGHFKDGKLTLKIPTETEPSYVVQKDPEFSCVAAVGENFTSIWRRKKTFSLNGSVLLYFRVVGADKNKIKEYRIHLYLVPTNRPHLEKLDDMKKTHGFNRVDKPSLTSSVYTKTNYIITGEPSPNIWPESLKFMVHTEIEHCPFTEINIPNSAEQILLHVRVKSSSETEPVWTGRLTRADVEELSGQDTERGNSPEHFLDKYRSQLIESVDNVKPVLDKLTEQKLLEGQQYNNITCHPTTEEMMRGFLRIVEHYGREDKDKVYKILKAYNKSVIKRIERGN
ncbi:NACHT, LRR and PYD domains-containing protein 1b allele 3-like [Bufo gargarizans]|uniref:NACHT, LRR and PYD domains-containing protein 1b allele 3-like n=1 Tax=Bufo gargarizans TaxID=30331 RepID=UPI001CF51364|nr:NACHT, LRR and PYD domains-containing protein 1b allele 3-like [Bufo gargarizans]